MPRTIIHYLLDYIQRTFSIGGDSGNTSLVELNLSSNRIGDEGACALADALKEAPAGLEDLRLNQNRIGDEGAARLGYELSTTKEGGGASTLKHLGLKDNLIGDVGGYSFVGCVGARGGKFKVLMDGNQLSGELRNQFCRKTR